MLGNYGHNQKPPISKSGVVKPLYSRLSVLFSVGLLLTKYCYML